MKVTQIKLEHFQNIVAIAYADGILTDAESALLKKRALEYGLSEKKVNEILSNASNLELIIPLNEEDKEEQLSEAVYMSMINGDIHENEYNLCLKIAQKLDMTSEYLDEVIKLTKKLTSR